MDDMDDIGNVLFWFQEVWYQTFVMHVLTWIIGAEISSLFSWYDVTSINMETHVNTIVQNY